LGRELNNTLKGRANGAGLRLVVGISDALPKLAVYRLIEPAFRIPEAVQVLCYEDKAERLLTEMSLHSVDLVISDSPLTHASGAKAFNHLLGESSITVFGAPSLAAVYRPDFPRSLTGAPFLLPTTNTALRRSLDQWFDNQGISPIIRAEIEDSALLKTFGSGGTGLFVAPTSVATEIQNQYGVESIGIIDSVLERFYAITMRRKLKHPAITAILENARDKLF
jgi:LysR family transcriptional activator of nhaA